MDAPREYALKELVSVMQGLGFVSDEAEEKLREAVDIVFDDPRNTDGED